MNDSVVQSCNFGVRVTDVKATRIIRSGSQCRGSANAISILRLSLLSHPLIVVGLDVATSVVAPLVIKSAFMSLDLSSTQNPKTVPLNHVLRAMLCQPRVLVIASWDLTNRRITDSVLDLGL